MGSFKLGCKRPKNAGRKKGTPNKKTQEVAEILAGKNFDPIEGMIYCYEELKKIALERKKNNNLSGAVMCINNMAGIAEDLAEYIYPKRKAIEHTGKLNNMVTFADFVASAETDDE